MVAIAIISYYIHTHQIKIRIYYAKTNDVPYVSNSSTVGKIFFDQSFDVY